MQSDTPEIAIITPVRNEAENLHRLYDSVKTQSLKPKKWVIIDDSSTDSSREIISEFASNNDWINFTTHDSSQYDIVENVSSVIRTGYDYIRSLHVNVDYYMVLDADMNLNSAYLETLSSHMETKPSLVIASGGIHIQKDGTLWLEKRRDDQPAGGATLFRESFIHEIDGFPLVPAWDSGIKAKAKMRGYKCEYHVSSETVAVQSRPTGGGESSWANKYNRGKISYRLNLDILMVIARSLLWSFKPLSFRGIVYLVGYVGAIVTRQPKVNDREIKEYYSKGKRKELKEYVINKIK